MKCADRFERTAADGARYGGGTRKVKALQQVHAEGENGPELFGRFKALRHDLHAARMRVGDGI